jgi:hypothetical protein
VERHRRAHISHIGVPRSEIDLLFDTDGNLNGTLDLGVFRLLILSFRWLGLSLRSGGGNIIIRHLALQRDKVDLAKLRFRRFQIA